ncbi:MAG TPA: hypothetical protein VFM99_05915 [Chitinophagales bacterium]|nr:hypothetical protein [Chitinophagales bacterium]
MDFIDEVNALNPLPKIMGLNETETKETVNESLRANLEIAYITKRNPIRKQIIYY